MRARPEDFDVDEVPVQMPDGDGEHLYLRIEKRGLNTAAVARALADAASVTPVDVGYAGMKDRHAVTRQWFSVRSPRPCLELPEDLDAHVLERTRGVRKLRRGQLRENRFRIVLRHLDADRARVDERLQIFREQGVPNYFGPQRFGRDGGNLTAAWAWLERRPRRRIGVPRRGLLLSAARAHLFNAVLAERVRQGSWSSAIDGDVLLQGQPTGPLWGRGRSPVTGLAAEVEAVALEPLAHWLEPLEHVGLTQDRRLLGAQPRGLEWTWGDETLELAFALPPGSYATMVLAELGRFDDVGGELGG